MAVLTVTDVLMWFTVCKHACGIFIMDEDFGATGNLRPTFTQTDGCSGNDLAYWGTTRDFVSPSVTAFGKHPENHLSRGYQNVTLPSLTHMFTFRYLNENISRIKLYINLTNKWCKVRVSFHILPVWSACPCICDSNTPAHTRRRPERLPAEEGTVEINRFNLVGEPNTSQ